MQENFENNQCVKELKNLIDKKELGLPETVQAVQEDYFHNSAVGNRGNSLTDHLKIRLNFDNNSYNRSNAGEIHKIITESLNKEDHRITLNKQESSMSIIPIFKFTKLEKENGYETKSAKILRAYYISISNSYTQTDKEEALSLLKTLIPENKLKNGIEKCIQPYLLTFIKEQRLIGQAQVTLYLRSEFFISEFQDQLFKKMSEFGLEEEDTCETFNFTKFENNFNENREGYVTALASFIFDITEQFNERGIKHSDKWDDSDVYLNNYVTITSARKLYDIDSPRVEPEERKDILQDISVSSFNTELKEKIFNLNESKLQNQIETEEKGEDNVNKSENIISPGSNTF